MTDQELKLKAVGLRRKTGRAFKNGFDWKAHRHEKAEN